MSQTSSWSSWHSTRKARPPVLQVLKELDEEVAIEVPNEAMLVKDQHGKTFLKETEDVDARHGALFGAITGGLIGLVSGPAGAIVGAADGAVTGGVAARGIDRILERLAARSSARLFGHHCARQARVGRKGDGSSDRIRRPTIPAHAHRGSNGVARCRNCGEEGR